MIGDLNVNNNKIIKVANPTSDRDAVTKHYADSRKPLITKVLNQDLGVIIMRKDALSSKVKNITVNQSKVLKTLLFRFFFATRYSSHSSFPI